MLMFVFFAELLSSPLQQVASYTTSKLVVVARTTHTLTGKAAGRPVRRFRNNCSRSRGSRLTKNDTALPTFAPLFTLARLARLRTLVRV